MADKRTKLGDLELENPIIVSSGYATQSESVIKRADRFAPGAIILKSSLLEEEYSRVTQPYAPHRYPSVRKGFATCEDGLLFDSSLSAMPLEEWAEWLAKNKKDVRTPLVASIASIALEGYVRAAQIMEQAGAVALEILLACPAPYLRPFPYAATSDPKVVEEVCKAVKNSVSIPVGAKIAPLSTIARAARNGGVDWLTLGESFVAAPGIDLATLEPVLPSAIAITGSRISKYPTFRLLLSLAKMSREVHISAHGGVQDWQDVAEYILYGTRSVQAQTLFLRKGFSVIPDLVAGLDRFMEEHHFATIEEMRGAIIPKIRRYDEALTAYPKTKGKIVAVVDEELCNGCGLCEEVCAYDAIKVRDGVAKVLKEVCEGCRLCVTDCPLEAITLEDTSLVTARS